MTLVILPNIISPKRPFLVVIRIKNIYQNQINVINFKSWDYDRVLSEFNKNRGKKMLIGYARVSTSSQNMFLQLDDLEKAGCKKIYKDVVSGAKTERPGLTSAMLDLREGDVLVVWKLDRLGRSLVHLIQTVRELTEKKIGFKSLQESIDTTTSGGQLIFHIFGALAEFERELIRERTNAGLESARARGRFGGRPKLLTPEQIKKLREHYKSKTLTTKEMCKLHKISAPSLYRYVKVKL